MNLNNITFQTKQLHKKPHKIKEHLSQLASTIKIRMDENQILMDVINIICIDIKKSKQQLKKFLLNQNKENAKLELNKNIAHLTKANKNLLIQKKMLFHKYIKLKNKYFTELEPINTEIKLLNDRKFILENIINRKEYEIGRYENNLKFFDSPLAREEKREIFSNNIDLDEDRFINNLDKNQEALLTKLKDFNKYHNRTIELMKEKENLNDIIKKLKEKKNINDFSKEEKNILFNKMKFKQEDAEKSLSRELKNFDKFKTKKKLIKLMIKKEKLKNKKLANKLKNIVQKINMMKKIVKSMELYNYKLSLSAIRDRKVSENVEKQFNALSGRNKEIMEFKLNYGNDNNKISKDKNK